MVVVVARICLDSRREQAWYREGSNNDLVSAQTVECQDQVGSEKAICRTHGEPPLCDRMGKGRNRRGTKGYRGVSAESPSATVFDGVSRMDSG